MNAEALEVLRTEGPRKRPDLWDALVDECATAIYEERAPGGRDRLIAIDAEITKLKAERSALLPRVFVAECRGHVDGEPYIRAIMILRECTREEAREIHVAGVKERA